MIGRVLDEFRPGRRIYLPGATGELLGLATALTADPVRMRGVHVMSCLLPGMNETDYASLADDARLTVFMASPALRKGIEAQRTDILPLNYTGIARYFAEAADLDVAIAHVAPPGPDRACSLGISADFTPLAWRRARRRVAVINPAMPAIMRGSRLSLAEADLVVELEGPLVCGEKFKGNARLERIASVVAGLVPDGAAVQLGLGGVAAALWRQLAGHRNLVIASGMVADDVRVLAEAGALLGGARHRAGVAFGSMEFYRYLGESGLIGFASVPETHAQAALAALPNFFAINGALEVDLLGQVNSEWRDGRLVSGGGGALDFVRGAAASPGGRSIIAMPATGGGLSKIVVKLSSPGITIPRGDADMVVTEFGAAALRDCSLDERAAALIEIAAPEYRDGLAASWQDMRRGF
jgi:acyl-CoA hydrolase